MSTNPTQDELRPATELRRRMIEDLQRTGMVESRQRHYVRAVRQLAEHYHKPPDRITDDELRQYCLHLTTGKKSARNIRVAAPVRFFNPCFKLCQKLNNIFCKVKRSFIRFRNFRPLSVYTMQRLKMMNLQADEPIFLVALY